MKIKSGVGGDQKRYVVSIEFCCQALADFVLSEPSYLIGARFAVRGNLVNYCQFCGTEITVRRSDDLKS